MLKTIVFYPLALVRELVNPRVLLQISVVATAVIGSSFFQTATQENRVITTLIALAALFVILSMNERMTAIDRRAATVESSCYNCPAAINVLHEKDLGSPELTLEEVQDQGPYAPPRHP